jgi:hypothetical protein
MSEKHFMAVGLHPDAVLESKADHGGRVKYTISLSVHQLTGSLFTSSTRQTIFQYSRAEEKATNATTAHNRVSPSAMEDVDLLRKIPRAYGLIFLKCSNLSARNRFGENSALSGPLPKCGHLFWVMLQHHQQSTPYQ